MKRRTMKNLIDGGILLSTAILSFAFPEPEQIMPIVWTGAWALVINETLLMENKKDLSRRNLLCVGTKEKNQKPSMKFQKLASMENKPTFRGEHRRVIDEKEI